jgi:uncharacterized phage-like protein YoqJ
VTVYAATGHRPDKLGGYYDMVAAERLARVAGEFLAACRPDRVIVGMAQGWDTAVAVAAVRLGIPFVAAVPFKGQESTWSLTARKRYENLLECADEVVIVSPGGFSNAKMQTRNEWMVDRAALVVAMWNGTRGGTANCLDYAAARGVPIVNLFSLF